MRNLLKQYPLAVFLGLLLFATTVFAGTFSGYALKDGNGVVLDGNGDAITSTKNGEMFIYENAVATTIDATEQWHLGGGFETGDVDGWTFEAAETGAIASFDDYSGTVAGTIKAVDVEHGLSTGDVVSITGTDIEVGDADNYQGVYEITDIDGGSFYFTNANWNATQTATWNKGANLVASADSAGMYLINTSNSSTPETNSETFDWKVYVNATAQTDTESRTNSKNATEWSGTNATAVITIADGDIISVGVKNLDSGDDITVRYANVNLHRL